MQMVTPPKPVSMGGVLVARVDEEFPRARRRRSVSISAFA